MLVLKDRIKRKNPSGPQLQNENKKNKTGPCNIYFKLDMLNELIKGVFHMFITSGDIKVPLVLSILSFLFCQLNVWASTCAVMEVHSLTLEGCSHIHCSKCKLSMLIENGPLSSTQKGEVETWSF